MNTVEYFQTTIPKGSYSAKASGYVVDFTIGQTVYRATFNRGVRGMNLDDVISVGSDGKVYSSVICAYAVKLQQATWIDIE